MIHPPIKNGTRVKAVVRRAGKGENYSAAAIAVRSLYDGQIGTVYKHYDAPAGICYGVEFEDGSVAFFNPEELEVQ